MADDIRSRSANELRELISRRPDLVHPMPADLTELAAKVTNHASVRAAVDNLDAAQLSLLRLLCANETPIAELVQARSVDPTGLRELWEMGLLWGASPAALTDSTAGENTAVLYVAGPVRAILDEAYGGTESGTESSGGQSHESNSEPQVQTGGGTKGPDLQAHTAEAVTPAGAASHAMQVAMQAVTVADDVATWFRTERPALRKRGGIGIRDLTALAQQLHAQHLQSQQNIAARQGEIDLAEASFWVELIAHAGFLGLAKTDDWGSEYAIVPTMAFDAWSGLDYPLQWLELAASWSTFDGVPELINTEAADGERINALSGKARQPVSSSIRTLILRTLLEVEPGSALTGQGLDQATEHRFPRLAGEVRRQVTAQVLEDGERLGILVHDDGTTQLDRATHLTELGRIWALSIVGESATRDTAGEIDTKPESTVDQVTQQFPRPVDQLIAQADMTLVVPGPPSAELRRLLSQVAERESTGGATVYRLTPATLRTAMATGADPDEVLAELEAKSLTPIPQPMQYLITDSAKEVEVVNAVDRGEVETTAAVSEASAVSTRAERNLDGYAAAVGNSNVGFSVQLSTVEAEFLADVLSRTRVRASASTSASAGTDEGTQVETQPQAIPSATPKETAATLEKVAMTQTPVVINQVDSAGVESRLAAEVVSVQSGSVTVLDLDENKVKILRRSRIAGVAALEGGAVSGNDTKELN